VRHASVLMRSCCMRAGERAVCERAGCARAVCERAMYEHAVCERASDGAVLRCDHAACNPAACARAQVSVHMQSCCMQWCDHAACECAHTSASMRARAFKRGRAIVRHVDVLDRASCIHAI